MIRKYLIWPTILSFSCVAVSLFGFGDLQSPIRFFISFWFFLICPGMALVPLLRIQDKITELIIAIALSLAIETTTATIMVYTRLWSPLWGLGVLIGICAMGIILQIFFLYYHGRRKAPSMVEDKSAKQVNSH